MTKTISQIYNPYDVAVGIPIPDRTTPLISMPSKGKSSTIRITSDTEYASIRSNYIIPNMNAYGFIDTNISESDVSSILKTLVLSASSGVDKSVITVSSGALGSRKVVAINIGTNNVSSVDIHTRVEALKVAFDNDYIVYPDATSSMSVDCSSGDYILVAEISEYPGGYWYLDNFNTIAAVVADVSISISSDVPSTLEMTEGTSSSGLTFTASASDGSLTYQWYKDSAAVTEGTSSTLTISSPASTDAGTYYCEITNTYSGSVVATKNTASCVVTVS